MASYRSIFCWFHYLGYFSDAAQKPKSLPAPQSIMLSLLLGKLSASWLLVLTLFPWRVNGLCWLACLLDKANWAGKRAGAGLGTAGCATGPGKLGTIDCWGSLGCWGACCCVNCWGCCCCWGICWTGWIWVGWLKIMLRQADVVLFRFTTC